MIGKDCQKSFFFCKDIIVQLMISSRDGISKEGQTTITFGLLFTAATTTTHALLINECPQLPP